MGRIQDHGQRLCLHPGWPLELHLIVQPLQAQPKAIRNLQAHTAFTIMGNVCACTQEGRSNFISLYSPCRPGPKRSGISRLIQHSRWAISVPSPRLAAQTSSHCTAPAGPAQSYQKSSGSYGIQDGQCLCLHPEWLLELHLIVQPLQARPKGVWKFQAHTAFKMGNICACTQAGRSNFISLYSPCRPRPKLSAIFRFKAYVHMNCNQANVQRTMEVSFCTRPTGSGSGHNLQPSILRPLQVESLHPQCRSAHVCEPESCLFAINIELEIQVALI